MAVIALPMYDWPEVRGATDAWGAGLARHLRHAGFPDVPLGLERPRMRHFLPSKYSQLTTRSGLGPAGGCTLGSDCCTSMRTSEPAWANSSREAR